ncbi:fimbrial protein [Achromobacter piechaudii]|uniref:Fimbrial protein n=1 Tax=Achromobacter piechaudii ATCC 43553 TaxID=742159 RepID=D4XFP0_9BURK|nr:fimbrial protein [Achromobacter piechaudii]EFF74332.1 fimbrial protein [Achromobacter piechaudii ATCC 43553]
MKINFQRQLLFLALCLTVTGAQAQGYPMTFNGRVTIQPCSITVDAVPMGDVPLTEFIASSVPAARYSKGFDVRLQQCDIGTLTTASLKFNGPTAGNNGVLALTGGNGAAQGIGVQVVTNDYSHGENGRIIRFDGSQSFSFNINSKKSTFGFLASYIRAPNASTRTAGIANATATVTLSYS